MRLIEGNAKPPESSSNGIAASVFRLLRRKISSAAAEGV
jgi:hypothetical protein